LHINKFAQDGTIAALDSEMTADKYPNLLKTIDPLILKTSKIGGKLYGVPQVNNAMVYLCFTARGDLASGSLDTYDDFEKFLYDVKQKNSSVIPYGCDNGYVNNTQDLFSPAAWNTQPDYMAIRMGSVLPLLYIKVSDAVAGNARVVPVWEVPQTVDAFKLIRKYYSDDILNHDILTADKATVASLFGSGKYAATIGSTNGLMTSTYGAVTQKVPGAQLLTVVPFGPNAPKPYSAFGAGNLMAFNVKGDQVADGLAFQEWLSIKENHDLLEYGIEGTDWKAVGDDQLEMVSKYNFPGFTMAWRVPLERTPSNMIPSERKWFAWSQDFDNFQLSPLAGFTIDQTPMKTQVAEINAAYTRYMRPMQAGTVDTDKGMAAAKKGFGSAGLDATIAEVEKQLTAFFKTRS
jgi:putative aldouronate transport system substrate-binding protein